MIEHLTRPQPHNISYNLDELKDTNLNLKKHTKEMFFAKYLFECGDTVM